LQTAAAPSWQPAALGNMKVGRDKDGSKVTKWWLLLGRVEKKIYM
jgi:hypothetical protein